MSKKFLITLLTFILFGSYVNAETINANETIIGNEYTNKNGVKMSYKEYEKLNTVYGEGFAELINQDIYMQLQERLKLEIIETEEIFIESKTNYGKYGEILNQINNEISEAEYNQASQYTSIQPRVSCGTAEECWETTYKKINLTATAKTITEQYSTYYITSTLTWKSMPSVRSYDLSALWATGVNFELNTYSNPYSSTFYTPSGTSTINAIISANVKTWKDVPGWVYQHKLPTGSLSMLKTVTEVTVKMPMNQSEYQAFRSTYQHASKAISSSISCVSHLSTSGLGSVIVPTNNTCRGYFDGMQGVVLRMYL